MGYLKIYLLTILIFTAIDFLWVGMIAKSWYQKELGFLLVDSVQWIPILLFYLIYPVALILFCIHPSLKIDSWQQAALYGAFLGFIAYAAYDLTNLATIRNWPLKLAICDMLWGSFVSSLTSFLVFILTKRFA